MLNCHEGISRYIGEKLLETSCLARCNDLRQQVIDVWNGALEMPPGCSCIELDRVLTSEPMKHQFIAALTEVHTIFTAERRKLEKSGDDRVDQQLRQIIIFIEQGEEALEPVHRPLRTQH